MSFWTLLLDTLGINDTYSELSLAVSIGLYWSFNPLYTVNTIFYILQSKEAIFLIGYGTPAVASNQALCALMIKP